jgi:UDP-N-acetylglucosamine 2-epimerase
LRTVSVVGARPQFIKLSPVSSAMQRSANPIEDIIVHTGQHYDDALSRVFFDELHIPRPSINLAVGSGPHGAQTAKMLEGVEACLLKWQPNAVVVYGDTNSTLAGTLAAAKLHIPVAHVEAGLRSFNRRMPEELNRVAVDHLSEALYAPTKTAMDNLRTEGLLARAVLTGDVMYDAVLRYARQAAADSRVLTNLGLQPNDYAVATLHRAENTAPPELRQLLQSINAAASRFGRIVLPMHPRTAAILKAEVADWQPVASLLVTTPLGYLDMLALVQGARCVLTDSGGLQKEAFFLGRPCVTLRDETEWIETLTDNENNIAGNDGARLIEILDKLLASGSVPLKEPHMGRNGPFGDGRAAERIVAEVTKLCESQL